jgi:ABC-type cobalamin/Fe3+-siderophores transport system ATPase subunit
MDNIVYIGKTDFRGTHRWFGYRQTDRRLPTWLVGKTGSGKTTLLKFLIAQDLRAGRGVCLIDLHGDLARAVLDLVPPERTGHVAYVCPVDEAPIGVNILEHVPVERRHTVASAIVSIFKDVWGPSGGI